MKTAIFTVLFAISAAAQAQTWSLADFFENAQCVFYPNGAMICGYVGGEGSLSVQGALIEGGEETFNSGVVTFEGPTDNPEGNKAQSGGDQN